MEPYRIKYIPIRNCIKCDSPNDVPIKQCACYKHFVPCMLDFKPYVIEVCRGYKDYIAKTTKRRKHFSWQDDMALGFIEKALRHNGVELEFPIMHIRESDCAGIDFRFPIDDLPNRSIKYTCIKGSQIIQEVKVLDFLNIIAAAGCNQKVALHGSSDLGMDRNDPFFNRLYDVLECQIWETKQSIEYLHSKATRLGRLRIGPGKGS